MKMIKDLCKEWPPRMGSQAYSGSTIPFSPNYAGSRIKSVNHSGSGSYGSISIVVEYQESEVLGHVALIDRTLDKVVYEALSKAKGKTLNEAGSIQVKIS